jgi:hypothetical protein
LLFRSPNRTAKLTLVSEKASSLLLTTSRVWSKILDLPVDYTLAALIRLSLYPKKVKVHLYPECESSGTNRPPVVESTCHTELNTTHKLQLLDARGATTGDQVMPRKKTGHRAKPL